MSVVINAVNLLFIISSRHVFQPRGRVLAVLLCLYLLFNKGGLTRGKTLQRRRGAAGGLYVFYYECYVARVEGVYLSGGVGEVMTHYVGRSVEGDEGVVVKVYCFARC